MRFGDKVIVRDGSELDGCIGVVYRLEENKAYVLLDKEVLWPVALLNIEPVGGLR